MSSLVAPLTFPLGGDPDVPVQPVLDHTQGAIDRLPLQFKDQPNIQAILEVLTAPMQVLEQALVDLLTLRTIDLANDDLLTILGRLVGQERDSLDDDTLRSFIKARIKTNRSDGNGDQTLKIARLILQGYADVLAAYGTMKLRAYNYGRASYTIEVHGVDVDWSLAQLLVTSFLVAASGTGIRPYLEFTAQHDAVFNDHDDLFSLDDSLGSPTDGDGLGDTTTTTTGGMLNAVIAG